MDKFLSAITPMTAQPSLSDRVADTIRLEIQRHHQPGDRLPAIRKFAERFEVSINTVHHALAVLRREGLVEGCAGSGTFVSERGLDKHVALVVGLGEDCPYLTYFAGRVLTATIASLRRQGVPYRTYWDIEEASAATPCDEDGDNAHNLWKNIELNRISAVGVIQKMWDHEANLRLSACGVPVVWDSKVGDEHGIDNNYEGRILEGLDTLVREGSSRIAVLAWDNGRDHAGASSWMDDLKQRFGRHGLAWRPEWVRCSLHPTLSGAGYEEFREVWQASPEKPDGLLVADDLLLPDVALAIREMGVQVPEQLRVVAMANQGAVTSPWFPATRLISDPVAFAEAMGGMLSTLWRKEKPAQRQVIMPFERQDAIDISQTDFPQTTRNAETGDPRREAMDLAQ